ncbi:MAG: DNA polymerase III subunit delta [Elusimicrobiaceae bacterium]|nr:DNA polymerase III subunit delta [Elusimicrobiaceae bacterium]
MSKISADKLQSELAKGTTAPVYLLTGEDVYRKGLVIKQLREILHPDDFNFFKAQATSQEVSEALAQANTAPVFSDVRVIVLTGVDKLRKGSKEQAALTAYAQNPLDTTTLILTHNDAKKLKTDKALADACAETGRVVNFEELKNDDLAAWVRAQITAKGLTPTFDAVDMLCESVGSDLAALENEIEKLSLFTAGREDKTLSQEDVLACIGFKKEENPFELSNALLACSKPRALKQIDKLIDAGEEPVAILSKMTYPILKMARIKRLSEAGMSNSEILHTAGLFPWESRLISSARNFPSQKTFLAVLNRLIDADAGFKSGANLDPKTTLKGIVLTLLK